MLENLSTKYYVSSLYAVIGPKINRNKTRFDINVQHYAGSNTKSVK